MKHFILLKKYLYESSNDILHPHIEILKYHNSRNQAKALKIKCQFLPTI